MGAKILGSGPMANVPFFGVALVSSVIIAIGKCSRSAEFQKIGIGAFFVLLVSGQVLAARVFGYFGLFGIPAPTLTFGKVASAFLVVTRVYLMTFR
ncbi:MAG: hypothetical protein GKR98_14295 [Boseongicola sp.]|nr:MAG: hypothetical protein GKR98_14295 [Boseongicola sp.]